MDAGRCFASATRCTRACSSALSRTEYTLDRNLFGRVGTTFQVERQVAPVAGQALMPWRFRLPAGIAVRARADVGGGVGVPDEVLTHEPQCTTA